MRTSRRAVLLYAAGVPLSLALILVDESLWPLGPTYLGLVMILTGADAIRALPRSALVVDVLAPEVLFVGGGDALRITLTTAGGWPATTIELACDVGAGLATPPTQRVSFSPGGEVQVSVSCVPNRRGTVEVHRLWLRWHAPLGLILKQKVQPISATIPVIPNISAIRRDAIRFASRDAYFGSKPQSQQGEGSVFESLRDYVPGLDHRSIDWKHSARHRRLVCKEFRAERNHQIILAFDTGHLMSEPLEGISKLDHAINAGLLLAYMSLRGGDRIGLFGFDSQVRLFVGPVGGVHDFGRLQRASAELKPCHDETNFTLGLAELLSRLKRRSLVILQTEFVDTITAELMVANLERLAARHLVVFVTWQDPSLNSTVNTPPRTVGDMAKSVIADDMIRERMIVIERLGRLGVHCLHTPVKRMGVDLVNRYLMIKRKELI